MSAETTGFVLIGTTEAQDATFAQYFDELPTGTVDLTWEPLSNSFPSLSPRWGTVHAAHRWLARI